VSREPEVYGKEVMDGESVPIYNVYKKYSSVKRWRVTTCCRYS